MQGSPPPTIKNNRQMYDKVKSSMTRSPPSGKSTTTVRGVNYQLLAVMLLK